jgi:Tol biopolymer transport system component/predicted Ser/Thr protein kinase
VALAPGTRLGAYEILSLIGQGGMGEVYRARDTRLDRTVAIKILPNTLATDPQFRERFEREAKAIAGLNHPHICTVYDVGHQDGTDYLVMEYLEGETLSDRLERSPGRPLAIEEALRIAIEIASALDAAHRSGIVHRDLKPGNVMLTRSGAKLLDFGLAKTEAGAFVTGVSLLPTTPPNLTAQGTILGTFQYMAPEQLEGQEADARTDIFAFGAVVYEMLSGRKAFEGKTQASMIGAILRDDPPAIPTVPSASPLDRAVRKCLAKDPEHRWRAAHDLHDELKWIADTGAESGGAVGAATARSGVFGNVSLPWSVSALLLLTMGAAGAIAYVRRTVPDTHVYRASIPLAVNFSQVPPSSRLAISPDGRRLAFAGAGPEGRVLLWVRALDGLTSQALAGTDGGMAPFWSPDGRFLAFVAGAKLKRIDAAGGPTATLCDAPLGQLPGTWNRDNDILFTPDTSAPLARVAASGGKPSPVTALNKALGETRHAFPYFLPDGRHFLYVAFNGVGPLAVYVGALDSLDRKKILDGATSPMYASGRLVFVRDGTLMAQSFDATQLTLSGEAAPVAEQLAVNVAIASGGAMSISQTGALVYQTAAAGGIFRLAWFDRDGKQTDVPVDRSDYGDVQLSPDGAHAAVSVASDPGATRDIAILNPTRPGRTRFTFDPADEFASAWSPDGTRLVFNSRRRGHLDLFLKAVAGAGTEELLFANDVDKSPLSWSPDGQFILYTALDATTGSDLWVLPLAGDRQPRAFVKTPFNEPFGQFSPDGKWVVYQSSDGGRGPEVYVAPFPRPGGKVQISTSGGSFPRWRHDGKEIFYLSFNKLMVVAIDATRDRFDVGAARPLFDVRNVAVGRRIPYDVTPDGARFLFNLVADEAATTPFQLVVNWPATLKN